MDTELISELMDDSGLGIKVRVRGHVDRDALRDLGEGLAARARERAPRVWVWIYGWDMDEEGPAMAVTYLERDQDPISDFVPPSALLLYYMGHRPLADGGVPIEA